MFTDLREVSIWEERQVQIQARVGNGLPSPIPVGIERLAETNVIADGSVLESVRQVATSYHKGLEDIPESMRSGDNTKPTRRT